MKNISLKSISRQLLLISILAIVPVGCATENEEEQQSPPENSEISAPNNEIPQETNNEIVERSEPTELENSSPEPEQQAIDRTENVTFEPQSQSEIEKIETIVYFNFDSACLTEEAKQKLTEVADRIDRTNNNLQVLIEGHADERGTHRYNMELGHARAKAVKEFLTSQGVNAALLSTESHGEHKPLAEGSHPEAWSQNRRVEFRILEPSQATRSR